jgi:hypothetical protein
VLIVNESGSFEISAEAVEINLSIYHFAVISFEGNKWERFHGTKFWLLFSQFYTNITQMRGDSRNKKAFEKTFKRQSTKAEIIKLQSTVFFALTACSKSINLIKLEDGKNQKIIPNLFSFTTLGFDVNKNFN